MTKNKKNFRAVISLFCIAVIIACQFSIVYAYGDAGRKVTLSGFSYSMDGSSLDSEYRYSLSATAYENDDYLILNDLKILSDQQVETFPSCITLDRVGPSVYSTDIRNLNLSVIVEMNHPEPYIDVFSDNTCIAFGGFRANRLADYFDSRSYVQDAVVQSPNTPAPLYNSGRLSTKSNSSLKIETVWEPARSNRIDLRVNTLGSGVGEWVKRIQIKSGYVPSSYVISSANPTGINTSSDFSSFLTYAVGLTSYSIYLPSFSTTTSCSSINGSTFAFDISTYVKWSDMVYTEGQSAKGMLFYLFLDHNGANPAPHGSLVVTSHVAAYGTMTYSLAF